MRSERKEDEKKLEVHVHYDIRDSVVTHSDLSVKIESPQGQAECEKCRNDPEAAAFNNHLAAIDEGLAWKGDGKHHTVSPWGLTYEDEYGQWWYQQPYNYYPYDGQQPPTPPPTALSGSVLRAAARFLGL